MKRIIQTLLIATAIVPLFTAGCGRNAPAAKQERPIVFGISPFPDTQMPLLGKLKGWYAEEGLNVEFRVLGWTEVQEALSSSASNRIDLGINNISSVVATHAKNPNLIYYYGFNTFDNGFALMTRPDGKIKPLQFFLDRGESRAEAVKHCAEQLRGKTVVTTSNTDMEQGVAACARRGGLDFQRDVKIIDQNPDDGLATFISGSGDAYIGGIPHRMKLAKEGMITVITGVDLGPAPINGIVTTKEFAAAQPEALSKILKVWFKIVQYTNSNLDEVAGLMVEQLNKNTAAQVTPEQFKLFWNNFEHYPSSVEEIDSQILSPAGSNYWKARWDDCNYYFYNIRKSIPAPVAPEDAFYMEKAQAQLKQYLAAKK